MALKIKAHLIMSLYVKKNDSTNATISDEVCVDCMAKTLIISSHYIIALFGGVSLV
jgi:hypothetical protein